MNPPVGTGKLPSGIWTVIKVEQLIDWSRRSMEAERDASGNKAGRVAAIEAHRGRLKKWEDGGTEVATGESPGDWSQAKNLLAYHRLEAEYWLAKAKDER